VASVEARDEAQPIEQTKMGRSARAGVTLRA
jgi:hypothetical protein